MGVSDDMPGGGVPVISADDVARSMSLRLPPGSAIRRSLGSGMRNLLLGMADELARIYNRAINLIGEMHPSTTIEMLTDWEAEYGLPDDCAPADQTVAQRRDALLGKYGANTSPTTDTAIALAASVGVAITITEPQVRRFGDAFSGRFYTDNGWNYTWIVNAPLINPYYRRYSDPYGELFGTYGNQLLECTLQKINPAHKNLRFSYS